MKPPHPVDENLIGLRISLTIWQRVTSVPPAVAHAKVPTFGLP
jgi:hypothetical protein